MLELLAGPYDITDSDSNLITTGTFDRRVYYDDDIGIVLAQAGVTGSSTTYWETYVVQLDGAAYTRGDVPGIIMPDLYRNNELGLMIAVVETGGIGYYTYNKKSLTINDLIIGGVGLLTRSKIQARMVDRFLYATATKVYYLPLDLSTSEVQEAVLTGTGSFAGYSYTSPVISRTKDPDVIALAYQNGVVVYYNHVTKTQLSKIDYIGANSYAFYSVKMDIWVRVYVDQVYIHASKPQPYAIATPTGSTPTRGKVLTYTTRVTGSNGEPCAGELVKWSLGVGSVGDLLAEFSTTDEDGYATVDYAAPVIGSLGSVQLIAEMRY